MTQRIWRIFPLTFHFLEGIIVTRKDIRAAASTVEQASHIDVLGYVQFRFEILLGKFRLEIAVPRGFRVQ